MVRLLSKETARQEFGRISQLLVGLSCLHYSSPEHEEFSLAKFNTINHVVRQQLTKVGSALSEQFVQFVKDEPEAMEKLNHIGKNIASREVRTLCPCLFCVAFYFGARWLLSCETLEIVRVKMHEHVCVCV